MVVFPGIVSSLVCNHGLDDVGKLLEYLLTSSAPAPACGASAVQQGVRATALIRRLGLRSLRSRALGSDLRLEP